MADYYDRLETQLAELTARGAHRRRRLSVVPPRISIRGEFVAVAATALIVIAVAAAVLGTRGGHHRSHPVPPVSKTAHEPTVLRNVYPAALPAPSGQLICESPLTAPRGRGSASGEVRFYSAPPTSTEMFLTARGLRHISSKQRYAVWLLPASSTLSGGYVLQHGATPQLLGVIEPPAGASGRAAVRAVLSASVQGPYEFLVTLQSHPSARGPGVTVLRGDVNF